MGAIATQVYRSLQSYWRRRAYKRLDGLPRTKSSKKRIVKLGGDGGDNNSNTRNRNSESLKKVGALRPVVRLQIRIPYPKKLLAQMRNTYVDAMLAVSGEGCLAPATIKDSKQGKPVWGRTVAKAGDFERRMMLHIYNTINSAPPRQLTSC